MSDKMYVSVEATRWVFKYSRSEGTSRLVLLAVAAHCNEDGYCWPGQDVLMEYANVSKPTLLMCVEKLEKIDELVVERGGKGPRDANRYFLSAFMEGEGRVKEEALKGKVKGRLRVKQVEEEESAKVQPVEEVTEKKQQNSKSENNKCLEEEVLEERACPVLDDKKDWAEIERKNAEFIKAREERKARKANGGRKPFGDRRSTAVAPRSARPKKPEAWQWFAAAYQRVAEILPVSNPDNWALLEVLLVKFTREEVEKRLSSWIDAREGKISGWAASDFLGGECELMDPEEEISAEEKRQARYQTSQEVRANPNFDPETESPFPWVREKAKKDREAREAAGR